MPILPGRSYPIGATVEPTGVNFCVYSRNATAIDLLLFDAADAATPSQVIHLDPIKITLTTIGTSLSKACAPDSCMVIARWPV
jgi:pullulanase/glycogen debranching enzyme